MATVSCPSTWALRGILWPGEAMPRLALLSSYGTCGRIAIRRWQTLKSKGLWMLRTIRLVSLTLFVLYVVSGGMIVAADGLVARWQFDSEHGQGGSFKALAGSLDATVVGPVRFAAQPPQALELDGDSKSGHRVSVTHDSSQVALPNRSRTGIGAKNTGAVAEQSPLRLPRCSSARRIRQRSTWRQTSTRRSPRSQVPAVGST